MKKIGFIAPYIQLAEEARKIAELNGEDVNIKIADGKDAVEVARNMVKEGVGVIISRGGTVLFLKDSLDIPIVELSVQLIDVMRSVYSAVKSNATRIGICGYKNIIFAADSLSEIYDVSLIPIIMHKYETIDEKTAKIQSISNSIEYIVGDTTACQIAMKYGLSYSLIESGSNSIMAAFSESKKILEAIDCERGRIQELQTILDSSREGIIMLDKNCKIRHVNRSAKVFLNLNDDNGRGKDIKEVFPEVDISRALDYGDHIVDELMEYNSKNIMFSITPVKVNREIFSVVMVFQDVGNIQIQEEKVREKLYLKGHVAEYVFEDIIGKNYRISQCIKNAKLYSNTSTNLLLTGETGTGKELFAQSIHNFGNRKNKPFVAVNCGAVPDNLLESELFGYSEGAFTGAKKGGKIGMFELAHKGTIFLDEVSEIGMTLQVKLLRVIQERKVMRLGDEKLIPIDVRIIAATNRNLKKMVREGNFREDLYYRLNVLSLRIPPLRERVDDIPFFVKHFLNKYCKYNNLAEKEMTDEAVAMLQGYRWKGNVRELENYIERLTVLVEDSKIKVHHIKNYIEDFDEETEFGLNLYDYDCQMEVDLRKSMKEIESDIIMRMLEITNGDRTETAKRLGLGRTTVWRKINEVDEDDRNSF